MKATVSDFASLTLDERGLCDLELLAVGGYSPLRGFLGKADHDRVVAEMRLADGTFWPVPITLAVTPGEGVAEGKTLALRDVYGNLLAFLHVEEIYAAEGGHHAAGRLEVLRTPPHLDFVDLRRTPRQLRDHFDSLGWSRVVAYQAREPIHRAEEEGIRLAARRVGGGLLIHPAAGTAAPGDVEHYSRIRSHRALVDDAFEAGSVVLSLLPRGPRRDGPREVLLNAIIARNYGCSDLIVDPQSAIPETGEVGVGLVEVGRMVYLPDESRYCPVDEVPPGAKAAELSPAQVRDDYLGRGLPLPEWYCRPAVAEILAEAHPPRFRQGLTIWFTGLSGSGKSTVAHALVERLAEYGRNVSFLDGDEIRTHLSKGLTFSKEDRDVNIRRVGYVAGLIARHHGTTLCSVISPYRAVRDEARAMSRGNFVEIFCDTPVEVCEKRDVKGLYAKARSAVAEGKPMGFTGVDDPYEPPLNPEVTLDTSKLPVQTCVDVIIEKLIALGYILPHGHIAASTAR